MEIRSEKQWWMYNIGNFLIRVSIAKISGWGCTLNLKVTFLGEKLWKSRKLWALVCEFLRLLIPYVILFSFLDLMKTDEKLTKWKRVGKRYPISNFMISFYEYLKAMVLASHARWRYFIGYVNYVLFTALLL